MLHHCIIYHVGTLLLSHVYGMLPNVIHVWWYMYMEADEAGSPSRRYYSTSMYKCTAPRYALQGACFSYYPYLTPQRKNLEGQWKEHASFHTEKGSIRLMAFGCVQCSYYTTLSIEWRELRRFILPSAHLHLQG
jgi:hypothetical protein